MSSSPPHFGVARPTAFLNCFASGGNSISVYASATLLKELADVLIRPPTTQRLATISRTPVDVLRDYATLVEIVEPASLHRVAPDPDDDVVIGTAVTAGADLVVTGDTQLLGVQRFGHVEIVSVADAISRLPG